MTKKEFVALFADKGSFESKAEAERKLEAFMATVEDILTKGEEVNFIGWGKFEVTKRAARKGRNPKTGEEIKIPAKKVVKFKAGRKLNDKVN